jgi:hypothetical protein
MAHLLRKECPNPVGPSGVHHHWSLEGKDWHLHFVGPRDYDHRYFGAPIEMFLVTSRHYRWLRPFDFRKPYLKRELI